MVFRITELERVVRDARQLLLRGQLLLRVLTL